MSSKGQQQGSGLIFLAILAVGLFYFFGNSQNSDTNLAGVDGVGGAPDTSLEELSQNTTDKNSKETQTPKEDEADDKQETLKAPRLLILRNTGASKQLIALDGTSQQVVFTDVDEKYKILSMMGTDGAGNAYALVGESYDDMHGSIAKITTDKTGKITILDSDGYLGSPSVSVDGKTFLITRFDNSENNFGFHLIKKTLGGSQVKLDHDPKSISTPVFSKNGRIAYTKGQAGEDRIKLMLINGATGETQFTFDNNEIVTNLAWLGEDRILVATEKLAQDAANNGTVKIFNLNTKKLEDFIDLEGKERFIKTSNEWVAMISGKVASGADLSGNIVIFNEKDKKQQTLIKAEAIVGWLN